MVKKKDIIVCGVDDVNDMRMSLPDDDNIRANNPANTYAAIRFFFFLFCLFESDSLIQPLRCQAILWAVGFSPFSGYASLTLHTLVTFRRRPKTNNDNIPKSPESKPISCAGRNGKMLFFKYIRDIYQVYTS